MSAGHRQKYFTSKPPLCRFSEFCSRAAVYATAGGRHMNHTKLASRLTSACPTSRVHRNDERTATDDAWTTASVFGGGQCCNDRVDAGSLWHPHDRRDSGAGEEDHR